MHTYFQLLNILSFITLFVAIIEFRLARKARQRAEGLFLEAESFLWMNVDNQEKSKEFMYAITQLFVVKQGEIIKAAYDELLVNEEHYEDLGVPFVFIPKNSTLRVSFYQRMPDGADGFVCIYNRDETIKRNEDDLLNGENIDFLQPVPSQSILVRATDLCHLKFDYYISERYSYYQIEEIKKMMQDN